MTSTQSAPDFTTQIAAQLPFLRRYARALTGNQKTGDHYAAATLEAILADKSVFNSALSTKAALFRVFHQIWVSSGSPVDQPSDQHTTEGRAQGRLSGLTENTREVLLLHSIEGFHAHDIAAIIDSTADEASDLLAIAHNEMNDAVHGRIMIIEDEAIIALDIRAIVEDMGHSVTHVARTRDEAIALARRDPPDMIMSDIQLADKSSGIDAVTQILGALGDMPVVFITAFPERLLTGAKPEPAFLITKPYTQMQVRSAVSQAMFFAGTDTLRT